MVIHIYTYIEGVGRERLPRRSRAPVLRGGGVLMSDEGTDREREERERERERERRREGEAERSTPLAHTRQRRTLMTCWRERDVRYTLPRGWLRREERERPSLRRLHPQLHPRQRAGQRVPQPPQGERRACLRLRRRDPGRGAAGCTTRQLEARGTHSGHGGVRGDVGGSVRLGRAPPMSNECPVTHLAVSPLARHPQWKRLEIVGWEGSTALDASSFIAQCSTHSCPLRERECVTENDYEIVLQKSIPARKEVRRWNPTRGAWERERVLY